MFDVYCPEHGCRVLLFHSDIQEIRNVRGVIEVHYRCFCGHRGILYTGRAMKEGRYQQRATTVKDPAQNKAG